MELKLFGASYIVVSQARSVHAFLVRVGVRTFARVCLLVRQCACACVCARERAHVWVRVCARARALVRVRL